MPGMYFDEILIHWQAENPSTKVEKVTESKKALNIGFIVTKVFRIKVLDENQPDCLAETTGLAETLELAKKEVYRHSLTHDVT